MWHLEPVCYFSVSSISQESIPCTSTHCNGSSICSRWQFKTHYLRKNLKWDCWIWSTTSLTRFMKMFVGRSLRSINCYFHLCWLRILSSVRKSWVSSCGDCYLLGQVLILEAVSILQLGSQIVLGQMFTGISRLWSKILNWAKYSRILCNPQINSKECSIHPNLMNNNCQVLGTNSLTNSKNCWFWKLSEWIKYSLVFKIGSASNKVNSSSFLPTLISQNVSKIQLTSLHSSSYCRQGQIQ